MEPTPNPIRRSRIVYAVLIGVVIVAGLSVRSSRLDLPGHVAKYAGDALYGTLVFVGFGWLFRFRPTCQVTAMALAFCWAIEFSQLYHEPSIDRVRQTLFGRLVLGNDFAWLDMAAYVVGILPAAIVEWAVWRALRWKGSRCC